VGKKRTTVKDEDKAWLDYQAKASKIYDNIYYQSSNILVNNTNKAGHRQVERLLDKGRNFDIVLEVGAGTGFHLNFVRHTYQKYYLTDKSPEMISLAKKKHGVRSNLKYEIQDASNLDYPDASFDRLISIYNLEHIPFPHQVLKEWMRVVKPGGVISISFPLDGGVAWRLGRFMTTRRSFAKLGLNLDYIIAREHINPGYNLVSLINYYFPEKRECYYPFLVPLSDINLLYSCMLRRV